MLPKKHMSSSLFRIVCEGAKILCKSFYKSIEQEIEFSKEMAKIRYAESSCNEDAPVKHAMTLAEAVKILNVEKMDQNEINDKFKCLFDANEKSRGGSFYLQSKIFRAKQRIDAEIKDKSV